MTLPRRRARNHSKERYLHSMIELVIVHSKLTLFHPTPVVGFNAGTSPWGSAGGNTSCSSNITNEIITRYSSSFSRYYFDRRGTRAATTRAGCCGRGKIKEGRRTSEEEKRIQRRTPNRSELEANHDVDSWIKIRSIVVYAVSVLSVIRPKKASVDGRSFL